MASVTGSRQCWVSWLRRGGGGGRRSCAPVSVYSCQLPLAVTTLVLPSRRLPEGISSQTLVNWTIQFFSSQAALTARISPQSQVTPQPHSAFHPKRRGQAHSQAKSIRLAERCYQHSAEPGQLSLSVGRNQPNQQLHNVIRQQTADSRQHTAHIRHQTADSKSRQQE